LKECPKQPEVIVIDSDDEDVRYQKGPQRTLEASKVSSHSLPVPSPPDLPKKEKSEQSLSSFLLERAKLENERLERQRRLRGEVAQGKMKVVEDESDSGTERDGSMNGPPAKKQHMSKPSQENSNQASSFNSRQVFWNGELRQTATRHAEERQDRLPTFKLTQVLGSVSP